MSEDRQTAISQGVIANGTLSQETILKKHDDENGDVVWLFNEYTLLK